MLAEHRRKIWIDLIIVLGIALVIRAVYLWQFSALADWNQLTVDNWYHHNWAMTIARGNIWGDTTYFRAPMYSWLLGAVYYLFGPTFLIARILGLCIGICSVALTYLIAHRIFGRRTALIAGTIQCIYPMLVTLEAELLLDPLFMLIVQASGYAFLIWSDRKTHRFLFLASFLFGLAAITRPTILALAPLVTLGVVWQLRRPARQMLRPALVLLIGMAIPIGVVFARNVAVASDPVLIASQGGINFYIGNNEASDGLHAVLPQPLGHNWRTADVRYIAEKGTGRQLKPGEISKYWFGRGIDWIVHNPVDFAILTLKRIWFSFANIEIDNNRSQLALISQVSIVRYVPLGFGVIFVLATLGLVTRWGGSVQMRWIIAVVVGFTLVNALFFVNSRFRLTLLPAYFILAAAWLDDLTMHWREKLRHRNLWPTLVIGTAVTFLPSLFFQYQHMSQDETSKGLLLYNNGDFAGSLVHYRNAWAIDSLAPEIHLNLGAAHLRLANADSAEWHFRKEISTHPDRPLAYANLGALRLVQQKYDSAAAFARMAIERRPYEPSGWLVLIRSTARSGVTTDSLARVCNAGMAATRDNIDVCFEGATALETAGNLSDAVDLYRVMTTSEAPPLETDDRMFTQTYWSAKERDTHRRALANMSLGAIFGKQGTYTQAAIFSLSAIAIDSTLAGAWVNLISAEVQLGNVDRARRYLKEATRLLPGDPIFMALAQRLALL